MFFSSRFPSSNYRCCFQFACIGTRLDLSYDVSVAAKFCANPSPAQYNALRCIIKFLAWTLALNISFFGNAQLLFLTFYNDVDFAMDLDDWRSHSRFIHHGHVLWASRKQANCASSTTEAEYLVASSTTKEIIGHRRLFSILGKPHTSLTLLLTDNPSALQLIKNPKFHRRTKHINVQYHVILEAYSATHILPSHVPTHDQLANIFARALLTDTFRHLGICSTCGLLSIEWEI